MAKPPRKKYTKVALPGADLIVRLQAKGLTVNDMTGALKAIRTTGYYRLLIYMRALQDPLTKRFAPGTQFEQIVTLYEFDRELRLLCLDAIERIEVALRAAVVEYVAVPHGAHFFLDLAQFTNAETFCGFFTKATQAKYQAITHYRQRYDNPIAAPIWAINEAVTFGALSHLYSGLNLANRKAIATAFGFDETVLVSWFTTINDLRNACAHHNRLWDKSMLVNKPMRANSLVAELQTPAQLRFYSRAIVMISLLRNTSDTTWKERFKALLDRYPSVPLVNMGFPADWKTRAFWL